MQQQSPQREKCKLCGAIIKPFTTYFRATHEPDSPDEFGYDVCIKCRQTLPEKPEPLHAA